MTDQNQADPPAGADDLTDAAPEITFSGSALEPATKEIEAAQEKTRGRIAGALVLLLFFIIVASFVSVGAQSVDDLKSLLEVILAPVVALVGSATGFYFGGKK